MLLDEDPATLIHHTIGNFNIQPDKQAVTRINDSLSTLQQSRELRMRDAESALRKLSRNLHALTAQHEEAVSSHDSAKHAAQMVELDTKKFRIAKAATELEIESERLEGELEMLKERLAELEAQGLEGDEATRREREADDATILRLKIYRSLGIDIEADEAGNFSKAVIRNSRKGDVHVVNMDPKFSRFFYANYFWSTMQGSVVQSGYGVWFSPRLT
ncbi:kinetochore-associated Ndc80 complex subunit spc24 [Aspergillus fumigatus]|nr:kinetochore-associated Ndc80 complex subunit spc24 [Aspergillus fumigatus]KAH1897572.1 kinetochore-associated Ndc80 complex subunit spc24 [Aspergillus fumigatus]KAH2617950.1 kinetochore-associated Ndc80 complex subunit spc24 [Aspergillus fumigatus]KAH3104889.1 kinetochore-associated Ndc80 complex subunit spc24 [Aspergillus fumigatus]